MLNGLKADNLLAELFPLSGIPNCFVESSWSQSNPLRSHARTGLVKGPHRNNQPHPFFSEKIVVRNIAIMENEFPRCRGPDSHLLFFFSKIKTGRPFFQNEGTGSAGPFGSIGHRNDGVDLSFPSIGDPLFGSIQDVTVPFAGCRRPDGAPI